MAPRQLVTTLKPRAAGLPANAGFNTRCLPALKVAAVVETLSEEGVAASTVLGGTDLAAQDLLDPGTHISYAQLFRVLANAARLSAAPDTAIRAGQRMHLSSYGMYGYGLMTCEGPRAALQFAGRYYGIIGPTAQISFGDRHGVCSWSLEPLVSLKVESPLYRFLIELQFSTHLTLHRDLLGPTLRPLELCAAYPKPPHGDDIYERAFGCPTRFGSSTNEIRIGNAWLDHRFPQANSVTHALATQHCEEALRSMTELRGTAGAVKALILTSPGSYGDMSLVAQALRVQERTLRRRLKAEHTTFQDLLRVTRMDLAVEMLAETRLSNEDIASRLGFSDGTSFRHAFRRWTAAPPSEFRAH
jgi:AraC-like DNA-binding protein